MRIYFLFLGATLLLACSPEKTKEQESTISQDFLIQSTLWHQHASEYEALCYQAYNIARMQLDKMLSDTLNAGKSLAVVADLDETVINNSPYTGMQIKKNLDFSYDTWFDWGKKESAEAIPGAVEFFQYCVEKGVHVYYISNRKIAQLEETINNLQKLELPNADKEHVLLRDKVRSKESRRETVSKQNKILLFLGDNLGDFSVMFEESDAETRHTNTRNNRSKFGSKFILFPNALYGDWESASVYGLGKTWTTEQKDSIRRASLIDY